MGAIPAAKSVALRSAGATISRTENKPWSSNALTTLRTEKRSAQLEQEYRKALREYTREYYWPNRKKMLKYGRRYREARKAQSTPRRMTAS